MNLHPIAEFRAHPRHAQAVAFSPDGSELITTGMDALAQVWSASDFEPRRTFAGHDKSANAAAISPDGKLLVTGSTDRTAIVWEWQTGQRLVQLTGHRNTISAARFSPDGSVAVTASYDGRIGFWVRGDGQEHGALELVRSHPRNVGCVTFSPDGDTLATSGLGNVIKLWDVKTREVVREIKAPGQAATGCVFLSNGDIFCWTYEGTLLTLSASDYEPVREAQMDGGPNSVAVVPDRGLLFCTIASGVRLLDAATLETVSEANTRIKGMYGTAASPDGNAVAAVSADGKCRVWGVVE